MAFEAYHGVTGGAASDALQRPERARVPDDLAERLRRDGRAALRGRLGAARRAGLGRRARRRRGRLSGFFNTWTARGYAPVLVSATGTAAKAVFAAVFEQGVAGPWEARHGLASGPDTNPGTFQYQSKAARAAGLIPRSVAIYGTAADRRYAGVWHSNPGFTKWHAYPSDTAQSYQTVFDARDPAAGLPRARLAAVRS